MENLQSSSFSQLLTAASREINEWAAAKGFWPPLSVGVPTADYERFVGMRKCQKLLLVVSELTELMEGLRKKEPATITGFTNEEEELADAMIRLMDYAGHYGLDIGGAIQAKMAVNEGRPYRHGKQF